MFRGETCHIWPEIRYCRYDMWLLAYSCLTWIDLLSHDYWLVAISWKSSQRSSNTNWWRIHSQKYRPILSYDFIQISIDNIWSGGWFAYLHPAGKSAALGEGVYCQQDSHIRGSRQQRSSRKSLCGLGQASRMQHSPPWSLPPKYDDQGEWRGIFPDWSALCQEFFLLGVEETGAGLYAGRVSSCSAEWWVSDLYSGIFQKMNLHGWWDLCFSIHRVWDMNVPVQDGEMPAPISWCRVSIWETSTQARGSTDMCNEPECCFTHSAIPEGLPFKALWLLNFERQGYTDCCLILESLLIPILIWRCQQTGEMFLAGANRKARYEAQKLLQLCKVSHWISLNWRHEKEFCQSKRLAAGPSLHFLVHIESACLYLKQQILVMLEQWFCMQLRGTDFFLVDKV